MITVVVVFAVGVLVVLATVTCSLLNRDDD